MTGQSENNLPIPVEALVSIRDECTPRIIKTDSLLEGHYTKVCILSEGDLATVLEINTSSRVLTSVLETLIERAESENQTEVFLGAIELQTLTSLVTVFTNVMEYSFGNGWNLTDH